MKRVDLKKKKKSIQVIWIITLCLCLMNACSDGDENSPGEKKEVPRPHPYQYDVRVGGICYTLVPKARVAKVSPGDVYYAGNIIIPSTIEHEGTVYQVEEISDSAFCGCRNLTAIVIPNSVKQIGLWTFKDCSSLKDVSLPEGLENIPVRMFRLYCLGIYRHSRRSEEDGRDGFFLLHLPQIGYSSQ